MIKHTTANLLLIVLLIGFLILGSQYAILTPPWQSPDEPAHYNYIAQVAADGCCPLIAPGDWDSALLEKLKAEQFPENADLSSIQYEDHQPPLFYLLAAPVFRASSGNLIALRLFSLLLAACVVLVIYGIALDLLPESPALALAAAVAVAFIPQFLSMAASANNDSLALLLISLITLFALGYVGNPIHLNLRGSLMPFDEMGRPLAIMLGLLLGLVFITKLTVVLPALAVIGTAVLARWRIDGRDRRWLIGEGVWLAITSVPIGLAWWLRDVFVYGWPDIYGMAQHDRVVLGQLRTSDLLAQVGWSEYLRQYATITFHSFWGQFGWMGVPMPPRDYLILGAFSLFVLIGLGILIAQFRDRVIRLPQQAAGMAILIALALATAANLLYYNLSFVQFQGRYLFPMLGTVGLAISLGLWGWALLIGRILKGEVWERRLIWLPLIGVLPLIGLAALALYRYIVPNLG
jgi:4-amino-4-deoxy-L-arabinose transferase-like glycosyltransferase